MVSLVVGDEPGETIRFDDVTLILDAPDIHVYRATVGSVVIVFEAAPDPSADQLLNGALSAYRVELDTIHSVWVRDRLDEGKL